jgi:hypothetical protein
MLKVVCTEEKAVAMLRWFSLKDSGSVPNDLI